MPKPPPDLYDEMHTKSDSTGWFVGIIVGFALLAIGYFVFSANSGPSAGAAAPAMRSHFVDSVVVDPETGCEYFKSYGYYPRLGRDGKQICRPLETK